MKKQDAFDGQFNETLEIQEEAFNVLTEALFTSQYIFGSDRTKDAIHMLLNQLYQLAMEVRDASVLRNKYKISSIAACSRTIIEDYATICWILDGPDDGEKRKRADRLIKSGEDLEKHIIRFHLQPKRARRRLPSVEDRLKCIDDYGVVYWYDVLNYFSHASAALTVYFDSNRLLFIIEATIRGNCMLYLDLVRILSIGSCITLDADISKRMAMVAERLVKTQHICDKCKNYDYKSSTKNCSSG